LSHGGMYDWCLRFSESYREVFNVFSAHFQLASVHDVNISCVELILRNRRTTVHDVASNCGISVENFEKIIHEHILFKKVCAQL
jgi:hypothetical protein